MLKESRQLKAQYDYYFLREYRFRYWLLVVNNHYFDRYYFFLEKQKLGTALLHSHELLAIPREKDLYERVLADLQSFSALTIHYRDTHQLVHPTKDITNDPIHGHS